MRILSSTSNDHGLLCGATPVAAPLERAPSIIRMSLPDGIVMRPAQTQDADVIGELTVQAYLDGGHMPADSPYVETLRNVAPRLDESLVLTEESTGEIIATIAVLPHGHAMAEATREDEWEFRYLAVRQDTWGQGLGRTLIEAVEKQAREAGASHLVLRVVDNNPRAQRLYEHFGYTHLPERDLTFESSSHPGRMITLLLYSKPLA